MTPSDPDFEGATPPRPGKTEWVGGIASMPAYVTGEGEPYRPEALFWMSAEGPVLGSDLAKPGELLGQAAESLRNTIACPMVGEAHTPSRVRVASPELARALGAEFPAIDIVCAPTPELDEMLGMMREHLHADDDDPQSYLSPGIDPETVAAFFGAAAALYRLRPWHIVPSDQSLIAVTVEQLGVQEAVVSVIGHMGQSFGLILFPSFDDFELYQDVADVIELGGEPELPPLFSLNFERGADLAPELRKEIDLYGWEVADPHAYPWPVSIDSDLVARPPSATEIVLTEAIARALVDALGKKGALRAVWRRTESISHSVTVQTCRGEMAVTLRAPFSHIPKEHVPPAGVLADMLALVQEWAPLDLDAYMVLVDELARRFMDAPEARDLDDTDACRVVMVAAAEYLDITIAQVGPDDLREIFFEYLPSNLRISAGDVRGLIDGCRAFFRFLGREYQVPRAEACARMLGSNAVQILEALLVERERDHAAAEARGFDLHTPEGIEGFYNALSESLPPFFGARQPAVGKARNAKKDKRKAARKARKRNR